MQETYLPGSFLIIKTVNVLLFLFGITLPSLIKKKKKDKTHTCMQMNQRGHIQQMWHLVIDK